MLRGLAQKGVLSVMLLAQAYQHDHAAADTVVVSSRINPQAMEMEAPASVSYNVNVGLTAPAQAPTRTRMNVQAMLQSDSSAPQVAMVTGPRIAP